MLYVVELEHSVTITQSTWAIRVAAAAALLPLAACSSPSASVDADGKAKVDTDHGSVSVEVSGGGSAGGAGNAGSGAANRDACLNGTWTMDSASLFAAVDASTGGVSAQTKTTGTVTVTFDDKMTITYNTAMMVDAAVGGAVGASTKTTFTGSASSTDYQATKGTITGSMPADTITAKAVTTTGVAGTSVQQTQDGTVSPAVSLNDGPIRYTCSATALTLEGDGATWKLHK